MADMSLVRGALEFLINSARRKTTGYYYEMANYLGIDNPRDLDSLVLGYIRDVICEANGYPPLTAVVVNVNNSRPGVGFWDIWPELRRNEALREIRWIQMVKDVFEFDWSDIHRRYVG
jgi:hypothetical protein